MIEAIAINSKGNIVGVPQVFSDNKWNTMVRTYGKKLRWKVLNIIDEPGIKDEELDAIFEKESDASQETFEDEFWKEPDIEQSIDEYTKRELIDKYDLSEDLMKKKKSEIIELINKKSNHGKQEC